MFAGDIRQPLNKKAVDDIFEQLWKKLKYISWKQRSAILGGINNARTKSLSELIDILDANNTGIKLNTTGSFWVTKIIRKIEFLNWMGGTYRIFEDQGKGLFTIIF